MKVLVCGMPRSMTTWAFNVVLELLDRETLRSLWIDPDSASEDDFISSSAPLVAKCHHFSSRLAGAANVIIYSYRDVRAAAVSCHRKFGTNCTREQVDEWVDSGRQWESVAHVVLRYESASQNYDIVVDQIRTELCLRFGADRVSNRAAADIQQSVENSFSRHSFPVTTDYDSRTLVFPRHRTFQPPPERLQSTEKAIYDRIGREFQGWLEINGYIQESNYGQELEYEIAHFLLKKFGKPIVIDIGVEKGSFTKLALEAGAARVIGFEPLPRHLRFLAQKYGGVYEVEIHPFAVSSVSGKASFHVATDLEGNELDYHHTLSDLGNSATVIRDQNVLEVTTVSLSDFLRTAKLDNEIDFLKIDTDGHDLEVLRGLGDARPKVILAEYWDNLPETSGSSSYGLLDLGDWARTHGYSMIIVIRRHGQLESVELNSPWTIAGDWGNVFFFHEQCGIDDAAISQLYCSFARSAHEKLCADFDRLQGECSAKEAEIRHLAAAMKIYQENPGDKRQGRVSSRDLQPEVALISEIESLRIQSIQKEAVIREQHRALQAFHAALLLITPILIPLRLLVRFARVILGKPAKVDSSEPPANGNAGPDGTALSSSQELVSAKGGDNDEINVLLRDLAEKERVIQEQRRALHAFRAVAFLATPILVPMNVIARHLGAALRPRLGSLNQYTPRDMELPSGHFQPIALGNPPKISLVTPSFNQAVFIERTLKSVLEQSYPNLEYFVQDGGSADETATILARYNDQLSGWTSVADGGQSHALNLAFARTSGEIMAWLNSDDVLLPGTLAYVGDYFSRHPEVDVVYGSRILVDEEDREIGRWVLPPHDDEVLSWVDFVPQETLFWRRSIWEKAGGRIDEDFRFAMDWDLLLRFREAGARMVCLPRYLGAFRIHEAQKTSAVINSVGVAEMKRLRQRSLGREVSQQEIRRKLLPYMFSHVWRDILQRVRRRLGWF